MNSSLYTAPHDLDALTLPRPLRLVSNALMVLCVLLALALPVFLSRAAQVAAAACMTCLQPDQQATLP